MTASELQDLLDRVRRGDIESSTAASRILTALRAAPFEDLGFARRATVLSYGFVEPGVPELGIAADQKHRSRGIGPWAVTRVDRRRARRRVPRPQLGHFHAGGNSGRHDIDETQELNYRFVMQAIADLKFSGFVSHEYTPTQGHDPIATLAKAIEICDV